MKLLEIKNVTKRFVDGTVALDNVSFSVNEGEFIVISGKNGSGKSVLMKHLNRLLKPSEGSVLYRGISINKQIKTIRQKVGLVFQNSSNQIVSRTVERDVSFGPENLGLEKEEISLRVGKAITSVGLDELKSHNTYYLSGGEKKRVAIAGILAMEPEIIILDEPFSNLDFPGVKQVLGQIKELHKKGHTIICITHDPEKVLLHAERLVIMDKGKIVVDDIPLKALRSAPSYGIHVPGDLKTEPVETILNRMSWLL